MSAVLAGPEPVTGWSAALSTFADPRKVQPEAVLSFREYVDKVTRGRFQWYPHVERLADVLQDVADGKRTRLMVFMPPRHGKSETASRLFTAYYLYRHPARWVGLSSYAAELAYTLSRAARENFIEGGGTIQHAAAVKHWETGEGGGLWAAGVGGPITGKGGHLLLIDDPLKNAEDAASETIREKQKEWYRSTFYTRAEPDAAVVVVQTRWHEDDLSGWLLSEESGDDAETAEGWHIVHFEAIKDDEPPEYPATCTVEPDPREPGEPLCEPRYPLARLRRIARRVGAYFWAALFQCRPRPKEGGFFRWDWFEIVDAVPAKAERVRYWDLAGTEGGGDFTSGALLCRSADGVTYIEHVERGQWSPARRDTKIVETAARDAELYGATGVHIWLEHEAGIGGTERTQAIIRQLAGYKVSTERPTGSKEARAEPLASQAEAGNVKMLRGPWNNAVRNTLADFPTGAHDDDVDSVSGAFNKLALREDRRASTFEFRV